MPNGCSILRGIRVREGLEVWNFLKEEKTIEKIKKR